MCLLDCQLGITKIVKSAPDRIGPITPPIILIVEVTAESVPVDSRGRLTK